MFSVYILFQVFRFCCLLLFTYFMVDCTLFHAETSVNCELNFTLYASVTPHCGPYCWKSVWLWCSLLTSFVWILGGCLACPKLLNSLRPLTNTDIIRKIIKKPYFWSLSFLLVVVIVYNGIIIADNEGITVYVEGVVVASKVLTLLLMFQLNFTLPPSREQNFCVSTILAYYFTLLLFIFDNLCKFVELSTRIAFKFYTVNKSSHPLKMVDLMLEIADAYLYKTFMHFFWAKLFCGRKDVLMVKRANMAQLGDDDAG